MNMFRVVSTIWHTKDLKYYEPGEVVDLSHLDGIAISALLNAGVVIPVAIEKKVAKPESPAEEG